MALKDMLKNDDAAPVINQVYDPLSQKRDGTITPCAPVMVFGYNFLYKAWKKIELCLCPIGKPEHLIFGIGVCKHTDEQILAVLPDLEKGEYRPAFRLIDEENKTKVYYFPNIWRVRCITLIEIYSDRYKHHPY